MDEAATTQRARKTLFLRFLLPLFVLCCIVLNYVYFSGSGKDDDAPTVETRYEYPMYDVALAFGDSITQRGYEYENSGWLTHLSNRYTRRMDILNRGFSAYNTAWAREVAPVVFPLRRDNLAKSSSTKSSSSSASSGGLSKRTENTKETLLELHTTKSKWPSPDATYPWFYPKVQLCILFFGANDAADPRDYRHISLSNYTKNLRYMVNMLHNAESAHYSPDTRVLIVTPPAVGEKMTEEQFNNRGWTYNPHNNTVAKMYAEAAIEVAKDMNLPFVDIWTAIERRVQKSNKHRPVLIRNSTFSAEIDPNAIKRIEVDDGKDYDGYDEFLTDGLHLNSNGNELLFELVATTIGKNWPELLP